MLNGKSLFNVLRSMVNGFIIAVIPKISNTLQILEPTTLPSVISPCPCNADDNEMRSSGDEVPIPTIVRPITNLDNLARCAIATDDSTK